MNAFIEIRRRNGIADRYAMSDSEMVLGRSSDVAISLPDETDLAYRHVLFLPRGKDGCWVSVAEGLREPLTVRGREFKNGVVPWGTELKIGSLSILLAADQATSPNRRKVRIGLVLAAAAGIAFAVSLLVREQPAALSEVGLEIVHPKIFGDAPSCLGDGDRFEMARRSEYVADSQADRYLYDPREGVRAVHHYREAAACYDAADARTHAVRARSAARALTARVKTDYAVARLNLVIAIEQQRWSDALRETRLLLLLTAHLGEHDYVEWLKDINGHAAAKAQDPS